MTSGAKTTKAPQLDFNAFVLSLGSSALIHLGLAPDPTATAAGGEPGQEKRPLDLSSAQQSIDLLALLQEKTRGNLTPDEARFLEGMLFELRMRFVEVARSQGAAAASTKAPAPTAK